MSTESPPPVSAAVICHNEQEYIAQCLHSLRWCEQVVLVDSGSTDATLEIARGFPNVEIATRPFDNFINQKNFALSLCRREWVLSLDADEVLTDALIEEIRGLPFDKAGYRIGRRSFIGAREIKHGTWSPDYQLRLFRKSRSRWGGTNPHETILIDGDVGKLETRMLHYSYHNHQEYVERNTRYIHMMVDHLAAQGRTARPWEPYLHCAGNFLKAYILRRGFLDGYSGYFLARHIAGGSFLKYRLLSQRMRRPT